MISRFLVGQSNRRGQPQNPLRLKKSSFSNNVVLALPFQNGNLTQQLKGARQVFDLTMIGDERFTKGGNVIGFDPSADQTMHNGTAISFDDQWTKLNRSYPQPFTVAIEMRTNDTTPSDETGLFQVGDTFGSDGWYIYQHRDGRETLTFGCGSWSNRIDTPNDLIANKRHVVIARVDNAGRGQIWLDGQASVWSAAFAFENEYAVTEIGRAFGGAYGDSWKGIIGGFFLLDRACNDAEMRQITNDFWGSFVEPDAMSYVGIAAAGPGPTFQPAWAARATKIQTLQGMS